MTRQRFSNIDVRSAILELRGSIVGLRLNNIYDISSKEFLLRFAERSDRRAFVYFEAGVRLHLTEWQREKPKLPSPFTLKLRKHIRAAKLIGVDQMNDDRIVDFTFLGTGDWASSTGDPGETIAGLRGAAATSHTGIPSSTRSADRIAPADADETQQQDDEDDSGVATGSRQQRLAGLQQFIGGTTTTTTAGPDAGSSSRTGGAQPQQRPRAIFHLIFELHQRANLVLTDERYEVLAVRKLMREDHVVLVPKELYPLSQEILQGHRALSRQRALRNQDGGAPLPTASSSLESSFASASAAASGGVPNDIDDITFGLLRLVTPQRLEEGLASAKETDSLKDATSSVLAPYGKCVAEHVFLTAQLQPSEKKTKWGTEASRIAAVLAAVIMSIETALFGGAPYGDGASGMGEGGGFAKGGAAASRRSQASANTTTRARVRGILYRFAPGRGPQLSAPTAVPASQQQQQQQGGATPQSHQQQSSQQATSVDGVDVYIEFSPIELKQFSDPVKYSATITTFSRAVESYFLPQEKSKIDRHNDERTHVKDSKLEAFEKNHRRRVEGLADAEAKNKKIADVILRNARQVDDAVFLIREVLKAKLSWERLTELLKQRQQEGHPIAQIIHELKLKDSTITVLLFSPFDKAAATATSTVDADDADAAATERSDAAQEDEDESEENGEIIPVDVLITMSAHANACRYHSTRKATHEKLERTIQATEKAAESARKKGERAAHAAAAAASAKRSGANAASGGEKRELISMRAPFWFEKFHWFITQAGFLVILGKDGAQTDVILRKYRGDADVFVNCDGYDAQPALVKNPHKKSVPTSTVEEAGLMVVARSNAWERKASVSPWWVPGHRVSKKGAAGEFLSTGQLHISAAKNYLKPLPLELGCAVIFISDAECSPPSQFESASTSTQAMSAAAAAAAFGSSGEGADGAAAATSSTMVRQSSSDMSALIVDAFIDISLLLPREGGGSGMGAPQSSHVNFSPTMASAPPTAAPSARSADDDRSPSHMATPVTAQSAQFPMVSLPGGPPSRRAGEPKKLAKGSHGTQSQATDRSTAVSASTATDAAFDDSPRQRDSARGSGSKKSGTQSASPAPQQGTAAAAAVDKRKLRKLKKIQDKYGEQDEDERAAAMLLLGHKASALHAVIAAKEQQGSSSRGVGGRSSGKQSLSRSGRPRGSNKALDDMDFEDGDDPVDDGDTSSSSSDESDDEQTDRKKQQQQSTGKPPSTKTAATVSKPQQQPSAREDPLEAEHEHLRRRTASHDEEENLLQQRILADLEALNSFVTAPGLQNSLSVAPFPAQAVSSASLRFAIFIVAPFVTVRDYRYKVRITPGPIEKKGQALKQLLSTFTGAASVDDRHLLLVKAISQDEAVQQMISGVKLHPFVPLSNHVLHVTPSTPTSSGRPSCDDAPAGASSSHISPAASSRGVVGAARGGMPSKLRGGAAMRRSDPEQRSMASALAA